MAGFSEQKRCRRLCNFNAISDTINEIAERNKDKPIFVISPFYLCDEDFDRDCKVKRWREIIENTVKGSNYSNATYISVLEALGDMSGISADLIHPNIYGVQHIADHLTKRIKPVLKGDF